jgi:hypothetical protein
MTNYRIFLLSFVTVSWVFLNGFNNTVDRTLLSKETQKTEGETEATETDNNSRTLLKMGQVTAKSNVRSAPAPMNHANQTTVEAIAAESAKDNNHPDNNEFEKPLDLSIPFKTTETTDLKVEKKSITQSSEANIFASETKKVPRKLELDGDFLMSPEPEAEKLKSVDGAGIVIKLKP